MAKDFSSCPFGAYSRLREGSDSLAKGLESYQRKHPLHEWSKSPTELSLHMVAGEGIAFSASCSMSARLVPVTNKNFYPSIYHYLNRGSSVA